MVLLQSTVNQIEFCTKFLPKKLLLVVFICNAKMHLHFTKN